MQSQAHKGKSKFLNVKCQDCGNEQVIFSKPAGVVKCLVCGEVLAENTGGSGTVNAKQIATVE